MTARLAPRARWSLLYGATAWITSLTACDRSPDQQDYGDTETLLMGELGDLGEIEPTVASIMIENSGETLVYLSSVSLTCAQLMVSRWLGDVAVGAQIIEIVVPSTRASGTVAVEEGGAEVNYAAGGKSSAYEVAATDGHVTFTQSEPGVKVVGTVEASYAGADAEVRGRFYATFCPGGQGY
ncbi:MAG TPA: hypothetical protein PLV93_14070, partial [Microthrixaceae bacterium]|nr:hypothetical protein [Nannocystaceae bacterium]HNI36523.1 hypothetical protein [Microthrixaceae bacterium]